MNRRAVRPALPTALRIPLEVAILGVASALAGGAPAAAQTPDSLPAADARRSDSMPADTFLLPEVVVTATRVPLHRDAVPTPVSVLTRETLRARGVRTVAQALRTVPGAALVQTGAEGAQTSLFLRGGESDYVKVLVDGVPVNEAGGAVDFTDLPIDQVDRIEVVRGPTSVLYGSDAVAGVVQIFTRRGLGEPVLEVAATGGVGARRPDEGTYGLAEVDATLSGAGGPWSYVLGGTRSWTEGLYPFNSERGLGSGTLRLGYAPRPGTEASAFVRLTTSESHFPTAGSGELVDANAFLDRRLLTWGLQAAQRIGDRVEAAVHVGRTERSQTAVDRADDAADTLGTFASELASSVSRQLAELRVTAQLPRAHLTIGTAVEWSDGEFDYDSESEFGPLTAAERYDRRNRGHFAQLLAEPIPGLHLTLGARADDNELFGTFGTWRAGAAWRLRDGTRVRGAWGTAFREPTFAESFGSGFGDRGNVALDPERSESWEVGVEQELGGARIAVGWFDQVFRDLVQYTFTTPAPDAPNYFNVGAASAEGLEVTGDVVHRGLTVTGSYTWLRTRVRDPGLATDAGFVEGEPLLRRPEHSGSLAGRLDLRGGTLAVTVIRIGEREDLDFGAGFPAPRVTLDPYTTVDLAADRTVTLSGVPADILVRVHNLLDADYEASRGFPGVGRILRLGLRVRLGR